MNSFHPISRRSANLERGRALQSEAESVLRPFNDDLSAFPSHEAVVLFAIDDQSHTASAVATVESEAPIDPSRHRFRRDNVDGHVIDLAATAFGQSLAEFQKPKQIQSLFEQSRMNPDPYFTWTPRPIEENGIAIASPELAFNVAEGIIPEQQVLESMYTLHRAAVEEVAHAYRAFERQAGPLRNTLELKRSVTPNVIVIRWDLQGSTNLMLSDLEPIASNYLMDLKVNFREAAGDNVLATIDGGDGQNIIISIPKRIREKGPKAVRMFIRDTVGPILDQMRARHTSLADEYSELGSLQLALTSEAGFIDPSQTDYMHDAVLWRVAENLKQK